MQNNKMNQIKQVMKKKGYYIVLFLCLVAVGTSGYLYFRNQDTTETKEETSVQLRQPEVTEPANTDETKTASKVQTQDVISPETIIPKTAQTKLETSMPVEGDAIAAYAADHLAYNETTKDWRTHAGIDISSTLGEEVRAAADGVVYAVYDDKELGKTIVLAHKNEYKTYYSNLAEEVAVSVGDNVTAGTVLGTVGNTSVSEAVSAPHLHFAVYQGTKPIDPEEFFNQ